MFQIFFKRLISHAHSAGITGALALYKRNEVRRDGLVLTKASHHLDIEWRAREIHPWDHDLGCSPEDEERLFIEQCLADTESAIRRLFLALPILDEIQFRVIRPDSDDTLLAGCVERPVLEHITGGASPRGRLRQMGINVCVIGFTVLMPLLGTVIFDRQVRHGSPVGLSQHSELFSRN